jgi:catechol 2,3-dioxygenase-like lactoylglutathione lyase family enzyme
VALLRGFQMSDSDFPAPESGFVVTHFLVVSDQERAFLNLRVADIAKAYAEWSARGADFLTEPKDHGREIRAYIRDPDGHLIEVGQTTTRPGAWQAGLPAPYVVESSFKAWRQFAA